MVGFVVAFLGGGTSKMLCPEIIKIPAVSFINEVACDLAVRNNGLAEQPEIFAGVWTPPAIPTSFVMSPPFQAEISMKQGWASGPHPMAPPDWPQPTRLVMLSTLNIAPTQNEGGGEKKKQKTTKNTQTKPRVKRWLPEHDH